MDDFIRQIAVLFVEALGNARAEGRAAAFDEAAQLCDHLARIGTWEHTLGAAECANRIREKVRGG